MADGLPDPAARAEAENRALRARIAATDEVLRAIAAQPADPQPVFELIAQHVRVLAGATTASILEYDGALLHRTADVGYRPEVLAALRAGFPRAPAPDFVPGRTVLAGEVVHVADLASEPGVFGPARQMGARSYLGIPLRHEGRIVGVLGIGRADVGAFDDAAVELAHSFAEQAVIALANARLTQSLQRALAEQTATSEVLGAINASPGDLAPVFDTMLEKALRLCEAASGIMWAYDGTRFHPAALRGLPAEFEAFLRQPLQFAGTGFFARIAAGEELIQDVDPAATDLYRRGLSPIRRAFVDLAGIRTILFVALRKEDRLLGVFTVYRQEVRAFTDGQIALVRSFAAQAVIAMENARLITAQREALEQQSVTAEVLGQINGAAFDLPQVLRTLLLGAARFCGAERAILYRYREGACHYEAGNNNNPDYVRYERENPILPGRDTVAGRAMLERRTVQIEDAWTDPDYGPKEEARRNAIRSMIGVPLMRDGELAGVFALARSHVAPFTEREIALVTSFAAQAAVGMQNAELVDALRASDGANRALIARQTASIEVLQAISASPADTQPVFDLIVRHVRALAGASTATIIEYDGTLLHRRADAGYDPDVLAGLHAAYPRAPGNDFIPGRVVMTGEMVLIEDPMRDPTLFAPARRMGARSYLGVPLLRDGTVVGVLGLGRNEVGTFDNAAVGLARSFAEQAVIAIAGARTLNALNRRTEELQRSLDEQTALAEVLEAITASPEDPQPVFELILERACALCNAEGANLIEYDGTLLHQRAWRGHDPAAIKRLLAAFPRPPGRETVPGRAVLTGRIERIFDAQNDPEIFGPGKGLGARAFLAVPLLQDGRVIGVVALIRFTPGEFDETSVALVQSFAQQAVIAIAGARTLRALNRRTEELQESLGYQTATSEVLQLISRATFDLHPVLQTLVETMTQLCDAEMGFILRLEGEEFRAAASIGFTEEFHAYMATHPLRAGRGSITGRVALEGRTIQIADVAADPEYTLSASTQLSGQRTALGVPLLREGALLGVIVLARKRVAPFTERQIELVSTFADQAVIAIENTRLITEQQEALARQTATAEILQVINANPGNLGPVFDIILQKAHAVCGAAIGAFWLRDGEMIRAVAVHGYSDETAALMRTPRVPEPMQRRMLDGERYQHIPDSQLPDAPGSGAINRAMRAAGVRTVLRVPLRSESGVVGFITANRLEVRPYTEPEIALLESFAAQAVIAMENARLLDELRESLEYQGAVSGLLRIVSSSVGELAPVFEGILERAHLLCGAEQGSLQLWDGERLAATATRDLDPEFDAMIRRGYVPSRDGAGPGTLQALGRVVHIPDVQAWLDSGNEDPTLRASMEKGGVRTLLAVPLVKDDRFLGRIVAGRRTVRGFDAKHIALLETFADQAVLAIENARLVEDLRARTAELAARNDAYGEQVVHQSATIDVLKAMSASPADPKPVFALIAERAMDICGGEAVAVFQFDGSLVHMSHVVARGRMNDPALLEGIRGAYPRPPSQATTSGRVILARRMVHIRSMQEDPDLIPALRALGIQSQICLPLMRGEQVVGAINLNTTTPGGLSDRQIELMRTFAEQAVIAIDSAETYRALQARTAELAARNSDFAERIEHQAATIDVLKEMSASPDDPQPVFELIVGRAQALCACDSAGILQFDGQLLHYRARTRSETGERAAAVDAYLRRFPMPPNPQQLIGQSILRKEMLHTRDALDDLRMPQASRDIGVRTAIAVPMLRDGAPIGIFTATRYQPGGFSDSQTALLQTFAEQAAIAIASAETYRALQERTAALARRNQEFTEQITHQAATIDVLKVMSASTNDTGPVFDIILRRAMELCGALFGNLHEYDGKLVHLRAFSGPWNEEGLRAYAGLFPCPPETPTTSCRAILERRTIYYPDFNEVRDLSPVVRALGAQGAIAVPLLRDGAAIGCITLGHSEAGGITQAQMDLLQTFAEQAVIAIGSVATFKALQQRTEELARSVSELQALEEVGRAVNASLELDTVLSTIIARSVTLARADEGTIYEYDTTAGVFIPKAAEGMTEERVAALRDRQVRLGETHLGRAAAEGRVVHVPDVQQDPSLAVDSTGILAGIHAVLAVPLLREGKVLGGLVIRRRSRGEFEPGTVTLLQTFAAQCVLAIENARLFEEARHARSAAEAALSDLRRTQDRLVQTEKLASLGQLTAGIAHEIKNPLNFVNNFADLSNELLEELREAVAPERLALDAALREEIEELTETLRGNLEKIAQHGRRADSIVKNMLLHSRSGEGEARPSDVNALAAEALNLAYHGARAAQSDFNITLEQDLDPAAGLAELYPQEITRVLLNLVGNGFYAARKRMAEPGFAPVLRLATRDLGDAVEIRVRDNGIGIPPEVRERIFQPFFTTKPAGEGTGLGLSLSHDIVVQQHGGRMEVASEPGVFTEFTVILPRRLRGAG